MTNTAQNNPKILLVGDTQTLNSLMVALETHLKESPPEIDLAPDCANGVAKALNEHYDVIITDTPDASSLQMIRKIKKENRAEEPAVVILSRNFKMHAEGINAGAGAVLDPYACSRQLLIAVINFLNARRAERGSMPAPIL